MINLNVELHLLFQMSFLLSNARVLSKPFRHTLYISNSNEKQLQILNCREIFLKINKLFRIRNLVVKLFVNN